MASKPSTVTLIRRPPGSPRQAQPSTSGPTAEATIGELAEGCLPRSYRRLHRPSGEIAQLQALAICASPLPKDQSMSSFSNMVTSTSCFLTPARLLSLSAIAPSHFREHQTFLGPAASLRFG